MVTIKAEIALKFTASLSETMESQRRCRFFLESKRLSWGKTEEHSSVIVVERYGRRGEDTATTKWIWKRPKKGLSTKLKGRFPAPSQTAAAAASASWLRLQPQKRLPFADHQFGPFTTHLTFYCNGNFRRNTSGGTEKERWDIDAKIVFLSRLKQWETYTMIQTRAIDTIPTLIHETGKCVGN